MENAEFKQCSKCKEVKNITEFGKNSRIKSGLFNCCKVCINSKNKKLKYASYEKYKKVKDKWILENKERVKISKDKWINNPENRKARRLTIKAWKNKAYKTNLEYKILTTTRNRMNYVVNKGAKNGNRTVSFLGCTVREYITYLESKFQPGMTWENHTNDGWHIDHMIPVSSFDLTKEEEIKKAFHYTNTQPLWAPDNISKKDKLNWSKNA